MARWDAAKVASVAPDAASLAAGRALAKPGPWSDTGCSDVLVWGRCQGSGRTPYQASVDLTGPAYRCTCPSRKFPCKHALALLLLWSSGVVTEGGMDEAAASWAAGRVARAAAPTETASKAAEKAPDAAGQAKRLADRLALMDGGVEDAARWLTDLVRGGLAEARGREPAYWDAAARRLVDAQLPGLARRVRGLPQVFAARDWTAEALDEVGLLWSLLQAWRRRDLLDPDAAADLKAQVGWVTPTAEVRAADTRIGDWLVLGARTTQDGRVSEQRTWLRSLDDGDFLLLLDFAAGGASLPAPRVPGTRLRGTLSRYPGSTPRRALLHDDVADVGTAAPGGGTTVASALDAIARQLAEDPWAERTPVVLQAAVAAGGTAVVDAAGEALPLTADADPWLLAAHTGGGPAAIFGEVERGRFRPLSVVADSRLVVV